MCKLVEDYGNKKAREAAKNEKNKTILTLLNNGMSAEWIHDTLNIPIKIIEQIADSIKVSK